jgi:putative protein-disulfide isomerase
MSSGTILWYFADPMCSWCWGFSPVIENIRANYSDRLDIAMMLGGLRPGTTEPMSSHGRNEILHHWYEVNRLTGQPFSAEGALPDGFIYDTEPASRAVITVADLSPDRIFPYFKSIQAAFYIGQQDVTRAETLADLASEQGVTRELFLSRFNTDEARQKTQQHFASTQQAGVRGFPTLVLQQDSHFEFISRGYQPFEGLASSIDRCLGNKQQIEKTTQV